MATLIPASSQSSGGAQSSNVEATYEDMFKEITRKLYGEETGNGLHTLGTPVAQVATSGPTAVPEGEQRSFTNLQQIDRSAAPTIEYEHSAAGAAGGAQSAGAAAGQGSQGGANQTSSSSANSQANNNVIQQHQQQQAEAGNSVVVTASGAGGAVAAPPSVAAVGSFKSEDHLSTAFGLAALMQNGFAAAGQAGGLLKASEQQQRWGAPQDGAGSSADQQPPPQLVQWTTGGKLQSYAAASHHQQQQQQQQQQHHQSTPKSKKHRVEHHASSASELIYGSPSTSAAAAQNLVQSTPSSSAATTAGGANVVVPSTSSSGGSSSSSGGGGSRKKSAKAVDCAANGVHIQKRYACTHCPYSTDRRDLYTRHENIHKDEKPFQCYACLKQFNRADHVKKHFLRMHRELQYDINKTRRHLPAGSGSSGGGGGGVSHHAGGRGNVTINASSVNIDNAFLEAQRHPTSSSMSIVETIEAVASAADMPLTQLKQEKLDDGSVLPLHVGASGVVMANNVASSSGAGGAASSAGSNAGGNAALLKPKREKRFTCCYCPWSGADKWGLKRHLNTHTKPFVCLLCDYKAARSERLATHVLKVHNKRACSKCSYLADTQEEFQAHMSDVHPHDNRPARSSNSGNNNNNNSASNNTTHNSNLNVLRTIGNTLVANNQLNTFHNAGNAFGNSSGSNAVGNAGGGVTTTIYTTTAGNDGGGGGGGGGSISGGPLQEIIVNPTSMVGWRLSANGSLIPPHDLLTGGLPNAAAQKRGSERLFQYLEADGSDPEDYARLLKMDAISRNTASVAQDFHKAGGVHELKIPANHQLLFNNKLPSQWTTREAAALLHSLSSIGNHHNQSQSQSNSNSNGNGSGNLNNSGQSSQRQKFGMRARQHSTGEDDENTPSSASSSTYSGDEYGMPSHGGSSPLKRARSSNSSSSQHQEDEKAMMATAFLEAAAYEQTAIELLASKRKIKIENENEHENDEDQENQEHLQQQQQQQQHRVQQLIKSSPAYKLNLNNNYNNNNNSNNNNYYNNHNNNNNNNNTSKTHRNAVQHHHSHQHHSNSNNNNSSSHHHHHHHHHRLDDKENSKTSPTAAAIGAGGGGVASGLATAASGHNTTFLTQMEYQNLNRIGTQFQNYVKDIINKYYAAETPLMMAAAAAALPTATTTGQQHQQSYSEVSPNKRRRLLSETEEYIEYLRNKEDITLTITPRAPTVPAASAPVAVTVSKLSSPTSTQQQATSLLKRQLDLPAPVRKSPKKQVHSVSQHAASNQNGNPARKSLNQLATLLPLLADAASKQEYLTAPLDFSKKPVSPPLSTAPPVGLSIASAAAEHGRSSRKQAQPKKIRLSPEAVVALLRDKYLNRLVHQKLSCSSCAQASSGRRGIMFSYHTKGSLALHRFWKHRGNGRGSNTTSYACGKCADRFERHYSLKLHRRLKHVKL